MFENNRVKFYMQTEVSELRAQEGKVGPFPSLLWPVFPVPRSWVPLLTPTHSLQLKEVVLKSSKVLRADVCVVGIGEWLGGRCK
jgi:hypothetical protein